MSIDATIGSPTDKLHQSVETELADVKSATPTDQTQSSEQVVIIDEAVQDEKHLTEEELRVKNLMEKYPRPDHFNQDKHDRNPEERANIFSTWLFLFISDMVSLGFNRPLVESDLWKINKNQDCLYVSPLVEDEWKASVAKAQAKNDANEESNKKLIAEGKQPVNHPKALASLSVACMAASWQTVLWLFYYQLIVRVDSITEPMVLELLLKWLNYDNPFTPQVEKDADYIGFLYALLLAGMFFVSNFYNNRFFHVGFHQFAQIRAALNGMIYTKALKIAALNDSPGSENKPAAAPVADGEGKKDETGKPAEKKSNFAGGPGGGAAQSSGQIVNLISVDSDKVAMMFYMGINTVYVPAQIAILIWLTYEVIGVSIFAGLGVIFFVIPFAMVVIMGMTTYMRKKMMISDTRVKLTNEVLQGVRIVKFYAWEYFFKQELEATRQKEIDVLFKSNMYTMGLTVFFTLTQPLVTVTTFLVYNALGNEMNPVVVFKAVAYMNALQTPLMQLPNSLSTILLGLISAKRIQDFLELPELDRMKHVDTKGPQRIALQEAQTAKEQASGLITTQEVPEGGNASAVVPLDGDYSIVINNGTFSWSTPQLPVAAPRGRRGPPAPPVAPKPTSVKVLQNIDFKAPRGKLTAIVGPVGCGKSSLVSSILLEMLQTSGTVERDANSSMAFVAQSAWIQTCSVKNNILFSTKLDTPEKIDRYNNTLDVCALRPDIAALDFGDETEIGDKGINLSGGQRQRISIARAVYTDSDIYMFDDPLSAVDAHVAEHIFHQCLEENLAGKTRILVTNQLHFLSRCDYIYVMGSADDNDLVSDEVKVDVVPDETSPAALSIETGATKHQVGVIAEHGSFADLQANGTVLPGLLNKYFSSLQDRGDEEDQTAPVANKSVLIDDDSEDEENEEEQIINMIDAVEAPEISVARSIHSRHSKFRDDGTSDADFEAYKQKKKQEDDEKANVLNTRNTFVGGGALRKGKQITEEELNTGSVSFGVYLYHFATMGGGIFVSLTLFAAIICQAAIVGLSLMLSYWSEDKFDQPNDFYVHGYASLLAISAVMLLVRGVMYAIGCVRSSEFYHSKLIHNILRASSVFYDTTPVGRILNRFSKDLDAVDTMIPMMLLHTSSMALSLLGNMVTISIVQPYFTIGMVVLLVFFGLLQAYYSPSAIQLQRIESNTRSPVLQNFAETLKGITTIRAFNKVDKFQYNNFLLNNTNTAAFYAVRVIYRWGGLRVGWLQNLLLLLAGLLVAGSRDTLSAGLAGLVMTFAMSMGGVIGFLVMLIIEVSSRMNSVERLRHYVYAIDSEGDLDYGVDNFTPDAAWPEDGSIEYKDVVMRYRPELPLVLRKLSFHIPAGTKVGVVGRTGSGKSSLMMLLMRLYEIESGEILIDGVNIGKLGLHRLRSRIGIVPQDPVLFSGTLRANLDPFNQYTEDAIFEALSEVSLSTYVRSLPNGLDYKVSEFGQNFSNGQRQLICMARVLLKNPKILLLDEATSSVDSETDSLLQNAIAKKFSDITILTIAHRLNTVIKSDKIMVLDAGTLAEFGTPDELINAGDTPVMIEKPGEQTPTMTKGIFADMYRAYLSHNKEV